jgi:hypothetical protein
LTLLKVVDREVRSGIMISEPEMQRYFESHMNRFALPAEYRLSQILIITRASETAADARKRAASIYQALKKGEKLDFLRKQVLTSRNVRGGGFTDLALGWLNYQIEHHLFPSMPRPALREAQSLVRHYCAERGVPYTEAGLFESWRIVVAHLNRVGIGDVDPFECPMAAQFRSVER